jgi:predicted nucleotidyltransferase
MDSGQIKNEIERLVAALTEVDGVTAIFLFGSYARGEAIEGSDVDLMVLFKDEKSLWKGRKELFRAAAAAKILTQVLARTVDEFWEKTEPTFREEILRDGRILYLSPPVDAVFESMVVLAFDLKRLDQRDKMKVRNRLQALVKKGARRLGRGCMLLRREDASVAEDILKAMSVDYEMIPALMPRIRRSSGLA